MSGPLRTWDDDALATALASLASDIDWPTPAASGPDPATRARVAIVEGQRGRARRSTRSSRWALVLAIVALLALAALAGAAVLGLPGLRLSLADPGTPPATATAPTPGVASPEPPGAGLGLGVATTVADAETLVGRRMAVPADARLGTPDAVYVDRSKADAVALVWAPTDALPATRDPDVGLVLMSFDGSVQDAYFEKILGAGAVVERVTVGDAPGYWISGGPHVFFFEDAQGRFIDDGRRWVGDTLVWADGATTYRLESGLGRDASIELAEGLE